MFRMITAIVFLISSNVWAATPIQVKSTFKTDIHNLEYYPYEMLWGQKIQFYTDDADNVTIMHRYASNVRTDGKLAVDYDGGTDYQCVDFVRSVSNANFTPYWIKGENVYSSLSIQPYTVIATFNGSVYGGHAGIYMGRTSTHMILLDQNWDSAGHMAIHLVPWTATGLQQNAGKNYYVVKQ